MNFASVQSKLVAYLLTNATLFVQPHNAIADKEGWQWATCAEPRAWDGTTGREPVRFFKYHPEGDRFVWFGHGLSRRPEQRQLLAGPPAPVYKDGVLYGAAGLNGHTQLIRWNTRSERIEGYTDLSDPGRNECPASIHDIAVDAGHRTYLGENDNHRRSSCRREFSSERSVPQGRKSASSQESMQRKSRKRIILGVIALESKRDCNDQQPRDVRGYCFPSA